MCEISKNNFFYRTPLVAAARNLLGHVLTTVKTRVLTKILFLSYSIQMIAASKLSSSAMNIFSFSLVCLFWDNSI